VPVGKPNRHKSGQRSRSKRMPGSVTLPISGARSFIGHNGDGREFVVQKHAARRLHYDLAARDWTES